MTDLTDALRSGCLAALAAINGALTEIERSSELTPALPAADLSQAGVLKTKLLEVLILLERSPIDLAAIDALLKSAAVADARLRDRINRFHARLLQGQARNQN